MKTIILAGGKGTRLSEITTGTQALPKPMAQIDGKPLLWHIMSSYSRYGYRDFLVAGGYLQHQIKQYFLTFSIAQDTISVHTRTGKTERLTNNGPDWNVTIADTGEDTMTGGRLLRLRDFVDDTFMFTYGDGIADVDIDALMEFHKKHGRLCSVTAVSHRSQFGIMKKKATGEVDSFVEKPLSKDEYVSAGFFVCNKGVFDYIDDDMTVWEQDPIKRLLADEQLFAFHHTGFWKSVDTLNDLNEVNKLVDHGDSPWLDRVTSQATES